jgi:hypothetical protein
VRAWRTATIGSTATVVESTLVDDVAPASKVFDTSWIKPGIAAWPWLDGMAATQRDLTKLKQWADRRCVMSASTSSARITDDLILTSPGTRRSPPTAPPA